MCVSLCTVVFTRQETLCYVMFVVQFNSVQFIFVFVRSKMGCKPQDIERVNTQVHKNGQDNKRRERSTCDSLQ